MSLPQIIGFESPATGPGMLWRRLRVSAHLAWRILTHEKGRTALALGGVFIAILLVFIELGFFVAVPGRDPRRPHPSVPIEGVRRVR